jgi:hypothetical protein
MTDQQCYLFTDEENRGRMDDLVLYILEVRRNEKK